ncbi:MAG: hypothetical protein GX587_11570 [Bacteroidales bacterium]|nr:hypothetical protein [Bacteroidales bacterium]
MEISKSISSKIEVLNNNLAEINVPQDIIIETKDDLTKQQTEIQPTSQYLDEKIKELDVKPDLGELEKILEDYKKQIQDYADAKMKELQAIAENIAKKISQSLIPGLPKVPPIVEQAMDQIEKIKTSVEDKILSATINIELKADLMKVKKIKEAQSKTK